MNVFEVGIILNGVSILYKQYTWPSQKDKMLNDPDLRNALLDAILSMSQVVLSQDISAFNFKRYKLVITSPYKENTSKSLKNIPHLIFYGIGDKEINVELVSELLGKIQERFLSQYPEISESPMIESSKFSSFSQVFDEILQDLKDTPTERFGHIF